MSADVILVESEAGDIVLALSSNMTGLSVTLDDLFDTDGASIGFDEDGDALVFPVTMEEGADGVYSTMVLIEQAGPYFARISHGSTETVLIVRVVPSGSTHHDTSVDAAFVVAAVAAGASSLSLTITDRTGDSAGEDSDGADIVWPQAMTVVPGNPDCWSYTDVIFPEGGKYHVAMDSGSGAIRNDVLSVRQPVQGVAEHFGGWTPASGYDPEDWVSLSYIRRWTGWTTDVMANATLRELRRLAIETFITETMTWYPAWTGTWYGLRAQGNKLYLLVPPLQVQDGGIEPVVAYHDKEGAQSEVQTLSSSELIWRTRGSHSKQPYVELEHGPWRGEYDVKITASFGQAGVEGGNSTPIKVKQLIVKLIRWHSLSFGVGPDEAHDMSTMGRVRSESSRDHSVAYHDSAMSSGLTGDLITDRELARLRVNPPPWAYRRG